MIRLVPKGVEDKKRGCLFTGRRKRMVNDDNLKVPMIPVAVNGEKQYIF
jgi:hypothetical protein